MQRLINDQTETLMETFLDWVEKIGMLPAHDRHERYLNNLESLRGLIRKVRGRQRDFVKAELEMFVKKHDV